MPSAGEWQELLNTDAAEYGGSGVGNGGSILAVAGAEHGQPAHAVLTVPPLGMLYLVPAGTSAVPVSAAEAVAVEFGIAEVGAEDMSALGKGAIEEGAVETGTAEFGTAEVGADEMDADQTGADEAGR